MQPRMFNYPHFDLDDDPPACTKNPDIFFPANPHPLSIEEAHAKALCRACPYSRQCRDFATANGEAGIWGGTTEAERVATRRRTAPRRTEHPRLSRYTLYEVTQLMMTRDGLSVRECAEKLGLTYSHVAAARRRVMREIAAGEWAPANYGGDQ